jgi:FkbM family methyltransferase
MNDKLHNFQDEISHFIELCGKLKVKTTIEIGAHEASLSKRAIQSQFISEVIALEANPFVFDRYRNTLSPEIRFLNNAAMNYIGHVLFSIPIKRNPAETFNGSINKRNEKQDSETRYTEVQVSCITIDSLLPLSSPIALWIDAEGANREVLLGADIALTDVALIMIEVEHANIWQKQWKFSEVNKFLKQKGFDLIDYDIQTINQTNCLYMKSTSTFSRVSQSKRKFKSLYLHNRISCENFLLKERYNLRNLIIHLKMQCLLSVYSRTKNLVSQKIRKAKIDG